MAKYVTDSEFKRLVRVCLDQNMSSEALAALEDVDTLSLDEIIDSKAEDAALTVVRIAPIDKLGDVAQSLEGALSISGEEPHKGVIQLPVDFERLVRFKMSSWQYAVFAALPPLPPLYAEANSEFGVCGTKDRPLVFLVPSTENGKDLCLEIFSAKNTDDVLDRCLYVARPKKESISSDGGNNDNGNNGGNNGSGNSGDYYYNGAIGHFDEDDDDEFITCAEASEIGGALSDNGTSSDAYSVIGYITEVEGSVSDGKQTFWMADTLDGGYVIHAYHAILPEDVEAFEAGMRVIVTGNLYKYVDDGPAVIEIAEGTVIILENGNNNGGNVNDDDYYYGSGLGHWDDDDDALEYVDLGLPSGTLWATKNVGAERPEEYGEYFAWGETEPKEEYMSSNYTHYNGSYKKQKKYCTNSSFGDNGFVDNLTELEIIDDAAAANLGSNWRMPSSEQFSELIDESNTTIEWITQESVSGLKITSKVNGKSIFLPAAGHKNYDNLINDGANCRYWTSTLFESSDPSRAKALFGTNSTLAYYLAHVDKDARSDGFSVRPVFTPSKSQGRKKIRIENNVLNQNGLNGQSVGEGSSTVANNDTWKLLLGERLLRPTVYYAAYLTALAVKDDKAAEKLLGVAKSLIEN